MMQVLVPEDTYNRNLRGVAISPHLLTLKSTLFNHCADSVTPLSQAVTSAHFDHDIADPNLSIPPPRPPPPSPPPRAKPQGRVLLLS